MADTAAGTRVGEGVAATGTCETEGLGDVLLSFGDVLLGFGDETCAGVER